MTTFTLTVDDHIASLIRRVAVREQKDETLAATQLLEWAANHRGASDDTTDQSDAVDDSDVPSLAHRQRQIRQIFERIEW